MTENEGTDLYVRRVDPLPSPAWPSAFFTYINMTDSTNRVSEAVIWF